MHACADLTTLSNGSSTETNRIQFSLPMRFLGGPGMLSRTSLASLDFFMMTSLSRNAVCMRRTSIWLLLQETYSYHGLHSFLFLIGSVLFCWVFRLLGSGWWQVKLATLTNSPIPCRSMSRGIEVWWITREPLGICMFSLSAEST